MLRSLSQSRANALGANEACGLSSIPSSFNAAIQRITSKERNINRLIQQPLHKITFSRQVLASIGTSSQYAQSIHECSSLILKMAECKPAAALLGAALLEKSQ